MSPARLIHLNPRKLHQLTPRCNQPGTASAMEVADVPGTGERLPVMILVEDGERYYPRVTGKELAYLGERSWWLVCWPAAPLPE